MSEILSQEEVDALLTGVSEGEIETESPKEQAPSAVQAYDLTGQEKVVRGRMPTLETTAEKFARMFRATMSSVLRRVVSVNTLSVHVSKYEEFMKTIPVPASLNLFKMNPLKGLSLFIVESRVVFALVDIIFGGSGREMVKIEGREFTIIENSLIKKIVLKALSDFKDVWKTIVQLDVVYQGTETNPQFVQLVAATDAVIVMQFEVDMGFSSGRISFCIPCLMVEPISKKLQSGYQKDAFVADKEWTNSFNEALRRASVNLLVELGRTELSGEEIANLRKGDVIRLDQYCSDSLNVYVEDVLKFKGQPGIYKGSQAVEISEIIGAKKQIG
ncbi:MAG: flagellar motor switch protein FliM [Desulfobacteraceae bacterium Eth-SRB1]|nr:MAG: flagellar motor switch protein FliM [Desulfobacteraceae bacterium Eth-SRB1]